jgi:hypothetical protein
LREKVRMRGTAAKRLNIEDITLTATLSRREREKIK